MTVAVLTYRRPDDLAALLPELSRQASASEHAAEVLVVDNDPDRSGEATVRAAALPNVRYVHEPEPGIAAGRNRAFDETETDLLVFIDDDERPVPEWLQLLTATWRATGSDGVVGPVVSEMATEPEPWVANGGFFERRRLSTGTPVDVAATNNLLLDMRVVRRVGLRFDQRFGLSGGSDTLFTRSFVARGARLVWCDEALVVDIVPPDRLTREWVLRRALRSGNSWSRTSVALTPPGPRRVLSRAGLVGRGAVRVAGGAARTAFGLMRGNGVQHARGRRTLARGIGMITGAIGGVVVEYHREPDRAADLAP